MSDACIGCCVHPFWPAEIAHLPHSLKAAFFFSTFLTDKSCASYCPPDSCFWREWIILFVLPYAQISFQVDWTKKNFCVVKIAFWWGWNGPMDGVTAMLENFGMFCCLDREFRTRRVFTGHERYQRYSTSVTSTRFTLFVQIITIVLFVCECRPRRTVEGVRKRRKLLGRRRISCDLWADTSPHR